MMKDISVLLLPDSKQRTKEYQNNERIRKIAMDEAKIDRIIDKYDSKASSLIQILLDIQEENLWLSKHILEKVSIKLGVPMNKVLHTATFYKSLKVLPEGHHQVHICNGTSCHVNGSSKVLRRVQDLIGIEAGEMDPGLKYSLEAVTCLGRCASGPVMVVDGEYHTGIDQKLAGDLLKGCD